MIGQRIGQKILDRLWQKIELRNRYRITEAAFKYGRFVLRLHLRHRASLEAFTPREDEAREFFTRYVLPVIFQDAGMLSDTSWRLPGGVASMVSRIVLYRVRDVTRVEILAPDDAYRDRLDGVLAEVVKEAVRERNKVREERLRGVPGGGDAP